MKVDRREVTPAGVIRLVYRFSVTFNKRQTITVDIGTRCYKTAITEAIAIAGSAYYFEVEDCCSVKLEYAYPDGSN